jgi:iodotyrosine deiodinase
MSNGKKISPKFVPLPDFVEYPQDEMIRRSYEFYEQIKRRRTVRDFSDRPVPREIIQNCVCAAGTAPNGANLQPWHFAIVENREIKTQIRREAEIEERDFYQNKAPQEWLDALAPLGTDDRKPFLETAPYLIVVFSKTHDVHADGSVVKHYYPTESTGIATGFLINALHYCGLATLTHTPSPMRFLNPILNRPKTEKPFLIIVTGYPAKDASVPDITKKPFTEIATIH